MTRIGGAVGAVALSLAAGLLAGCDDDEPATVDVPDTLLSAEQVGAPAVGDGVRQLNGAASPCGPDSTALVAGATDENTMAYHGAGTAEVVVIGSWTLPSSQARSALRQLRVHLDPARCRTSPPTRVRALDSTLKGSVSFAVVGTLDGGRYSLVRSYTYLPAKQTLVLVSMQRTGEGDPPPDELARLTREQVRLSR